MIYLITASVLIAAASFAADKIAWLKSRKKMLGIYFGILGILADCASADISGLHIMVSLRDAPVLIASLFFGPESGLIAGMIAALGRMIAPIWGDGLENPILNGVMTILVAVYAFAMRKLVFEEKRPTVIPAFFAAVFGEFFHFAMIFLFRIGWTNQAHTLELLYAWYPAIPIWAGVSSGLTAVFCGTWRPWRKNLTSLLTWGFLLFGTALFIVAKNSEENGMKHTRVALNSAVRTLETDINDQIGYMLHCNAVSLRKFLKGQDFLTTEIVWDYAQNYDVDEINIFRKDGTLIISNRPEVIARNKKPSKDGDLKEFFQLTDGKVSSIRQDFRASRSEPNLLVKYIGVPLWNRTAFLQMGYTWKRLEKDFSTFFFPIFPKARIGETGYFMITDQKGRLMISVCGHPHSAGKYLSDIGMTESEFAHCPGRFFESRLFNTWGMCLRCNDLGPWRIYAVLPYVEFFIPAVRQTAIVWLLLFAVFIVSRIFMLRIYHVQKKIDDMLLADMKLAATIQNSELPGTGLETKSCSIHALMIPAKEVGGDFYDYYELPDGRMVIAIADVSGKGVPAAFFMMKAKNALKSAMFRLQDPAETTTEANRTLFANNEAFMFVTVWLGIFDPESGILSYASAGHNPPLVKRKNGDVQWLKSGIRCKPLAAFPNSRYQTETLSLESGDTLCLYTDGVTEAVDSMKHLYGNDRLEEQLNKLSGDLISGILDNLNRFSAGTEQADDITMLTLEVKNHESDC